MTAISRFVKYLKGLGVFEEAVLRSACERMESYGESTPGDLARILIKEYGLDHDEVYRSLARHYAFGEFNIDVSKLGSTHYNQLKQALDKIDPQFLYALMETDVVPFRLTGASGEGLQVLAANITDPLIATIEKQTCFRRVEVFWSPLSTLHEIVRLIKHPPPGSSHVKEEAQSHALDISAMVEDVDDTAVNDEINKGFLVDIFDTALVEAVRSDASDLHVIPAGRSSVDIFFRIDGLLVLWHHQENTAPEALASVIKDRSVGIDRFARDKAQDGYAQRNIDGHLIRFRVSILPVVSAEFERRYESIVIRVIDDRKVITDFRNLGFQKHAEQELIKAITASKGIVILTGPTGSGKSTTLMAALNHIIRPSLNVLTCEDPVEYVIKGARQLKIGYNMSFEEAMRSILRHDPDVVMVGEIRDKVTADIAVKLANTGHLTLTTLHTNDAPSAITRLYKMGVEPFLLAYSINIIIAQRLVRKLCDHCKQPITPDQYDTALALGLKQEDLESGKIFMPVGCDHCQDGYRGRINIAEALYFYPNIRSEIIDTAHDLDEDRIRGLAARHGMLSMRDSGIERIRAGQTSITEVLYATSEE